ncbi:hypothetical protein BU15DRAFT_81645 [Melanogaster broomeanus]|nr:hypothetical protein BU15DRAFT_81645 [Melanogaster broomeanus]
MATWLVGHTPSLLPVRAGICLDILPSRPWLQARASSHLAVGPKAPPPTSSSKPVKPRLTLDRNSTRGVILESNRLLAAKVRALRTALRSPLMPRPSDICDVIRSYQLFNSSLSATNPRRRTRTLILLRSLFHRHWHSRKSTISWAFAEILFHHRRNQHMQVLLVFVQYFRLVGTQNTLVTSLIRGHVQQASQKDVDLLVVPPRSAEEKFQVNEIITAIVWESALFLSTETEADELYSILLMHAKHWREQTAEAREQHIPTDQDINAARLFTPFLSVFAKRSPSKLLEVVSDMEGLGMKPDMAQWDIIAGAYAHFDPVLALRILDRVEEIELKDLKKSGADAYGGQESHRQVATRRLSDNLLRAHTSVMQKFIHVDDTVHAREVEKRLVERFGYQAGDRHVTDVAIRILRRREKTRESRGLPP